MGIETLFNDWYKRAEQVSPIRIRTLTRRRLIELFGEHGLTQGAEIGVDRGRFSEYMLTKIPDSHILSVDPWYWKLRGESRYKSTVTRLAPYGERSTIVRKESFEAVLDIPDESLDFVYIDGNHTFDYVMTDIIWWAMKVRMGGVVAGHDYYRFRRGGVVPAVDIYTQQHQITKWFLTDERTPSWFWIREPSFADTPEDQD